MATAHVIFEVNQTKIKGGCQSGRKVAPHNSNSDLPLIKMKKTDDVENAILILFPKFFGKVTKITG